MAQAAADDMAFDPVNHTSEPVKGGEPRAQPRRVA
jgi:hypothetical protein